MNFDQVVAFVNGAILTGVALVIGHYFPLPGKKDKLPKSVVNLIGRYVYGVASIWLGVLVWLGLMGQVMIALGILGICAVGGLAVAFAYWYDDWWETKEQRERLTSDVRDVDVSKKV